MEETTIYSLEAANALRRPATNYSASDVKRAREAWLDAREAVRESEAELYNVQAQYSRLARNGRVEVVERASNALSDAKEHVLQAEAEFHEILKQAGHLEGIEANKNQLAQMQKDEATLAEARAAQAMEEYRHQIQPLYLYNGGSIEMFDAAFPGLWRKEVTRRTLEGRDMLKEKLQARGTYPI